uniref:Uncharacterized protein n=1 Tax=Haptolina brevifila TaxID=156173 RepID=A0A7S2MYE2_9EUKA|mmetsp:Transcript_61750/g.122063  ORF Transcript_61750/g.122063 Transcript_61750/m.122063 type:complete len:104 (+) Transcript_61750:42-353(+)
MGAQGKDIDKRDAEVIIKYPSRPELYCLMGVWYLSHELQAGAWKTLRYTLSCEDKCTPVAWASQEVWVKPTSQGDVGNSSGRPRLNSKGGHGLPVARQAAAAA